MSQRGRVSVTEGDGLVSDCVMERNRIVPDSVIEGDGLHGLQV